ncbi:hypothetical protein [Arthrobacter sp. SLBN-53]|uniref:hypothetical protein n=1 Tax=Arthrobacter sp. SLBN-53 TaxID=2768412 RepID=UPI001152095E|nr:hypothetical protein [Arthrobacter sp. SLBN-53]TQK28411.1 hypothetical protein FBY28_1394 [Arthrobacter sp. SLBN-53]
MARVLLQTTIPFDAQDWSVERFSMLADVLRVAGHQVVARNRARGGDDPVLAGLDRSDFDQLWLLAVDTGAGLTERECGAIAGFRRRGGGVLTARDHQDLGRCLSALGSLGGVNRFHDESVDPADLRDDMDNPEISWPNYHSGANGDYQPVLDCGHELLATAAVCSGRIEWFPAHPHEGLVTAEVPGARVVAQGRSATTGRVFNLAVALDGDRAADGSMLGRALACSTFHHFADYNWDVERGAPDFVTERPGRGIKDDPARLDVFFDYVRNIARWLTPTDPGRGE